MTENRKSSESNSNEDSDVEITGPEIPLIELDTSGPEVLSINDEEEDGEILFEIRFPNEEMHERGKPILDLIRAYCEQSDEYIKIDEEGLRTVYYLVANKEEESEEGDTMDGMFTIDTTPTQNIASYVPSYKRTIKSLLTDEQPEKEDETLNARPQKASYCFNCNGSHNFKECPEPRNPQKIAKNRKLFGPAKQTERYHIDIEQKFAHFQPGVVSRQLRDALGLNDERRLPPFIYRMRELGYPPGWLEHIKVSHSGLSLFDSEGNEILESDQEDGEVTSGKCKYDVKKIISFPGYNVDPPEDFVDESRQYRSRPMLPHHTKEAFIKSLDGNVATAYRKKKLKASFGKPVDKEVSEEAVVADMEVEDIPENAEDTIEFIRPKPPPDEIPPPPPFVMPPEDEDNEVDEPNETNINEDEMTLEDLQRKQMELMAELQNASALSSRPEDDSLVDEILLLDETAENDSQESQTSKTSLAESTSRLSTSSEPPHKKRSILGTPVLKFSPYEKLPPGEYFSVGVSDVINFENLPDSTGKYEQMKNVIQKVRTVTRRLQNECED